jgi:four helix bundle protein
MEIGKEKVATAPSISRAASVRDFTDLEAWQVARELRRDVYAICKSFPKDETFGLISQIKLAATSVTANIAEGFGRYSYQENIQFCRQSRGSVYEVRDHLIASFDAGFLPQGKLDDLDAKALSVIKLLNGYIRATTLRKNAKGTAH